MLPIEKAYEIVGGISAMAHISILPLGLFLSGVKKFLRNVAQRLKSLPLEKLRNPTYALIYGTNLPTFTKKKTIKNRRKLWG